MKVKALKTQTTTLRPIKALMVYPPNTPTTLVPRVLPTKSQVKINIFALTQLFSDFEKTCNKRITPTGLTEGEKGFEQTKACYLTEVIPFFKTLKEHFEGIQKALTKEIKEMNIFEELEAEVDQNGVDRKHNEIERKNLLIANDNLIADCLYKEVFYVATNSELNVSSFTEMHDAHTSLKAQQNELFRAENGKIKQHYKELYDSIKITRAKHQEQTTALLTENESLKVQIQNNLSCVNMDHVKPKVLAPGKYAIDVEPIPPRNRNNREVHLVYLKHLKESVETLREIIEEAKVERPLDSSLASACLYTKHSQELLEYVIATCPKDLNTRDNKHASTPLPKKKQVTFEETMWQCQKSQPRSNTKKNRILPAECQHKESRTDRPLVFGLRFGNDHFGAIMGYGDYVIGESVISRVYYVEGLGHTDLEVAFRKHSCYVRDTDGVELIKGSCSSNLQNRTLVEAARTMLIFSKAPMFLWAEVVATACYTQNRSLIHTRHCKTPYELVHDKKPDLTFFRVFGAPYYPTNNSEDLGKLQPTADIGIFVGYAPSRKGYKIYNKRTQRIMETIHVQFEEWTSKMAPCNSVQDRSFFSGRQDNKFQARTKFGSSQDLLMYPLIIKYEEIFIPKQCSLNTWNLLVVERPCFSASRFSSTESDLYFVHSSKSRFELSQGIPPQ
ncbi:retrovirus-related pol polyprotein from transposon TNT 1-94 [Tanacetum coccineum]